MDSGIGSNPGFVSGIFGRFHNCLSFAVFLSSWWASTEIVLPGSGCMLRQLWYGNDVVGL